MPEGWVLGAADPLAALQSLAREWRRELGREGGRDHRLDRQDLGQGRLRAILPLRVHASPENFNTEIGMPLAVLAAPARDRGAGAGDGDARRPTRSPSWPRSPSPTSA